SSGAPLPLGLMLRVDSCLRCRSRLVALEPNRVDQRSVTPVDAVRRLGTVVALPFRRGDQKADPNVDRVIDRAPVSAGRREPLVAAEEERAEAHSSRGSVLP